jgi:nitric-oxide synthase
MNDPNTPPASGCPLHGHHAKRWDLVDSAELLKSAAAADVSLEQAGREAWRNAVRCIGRLHWKSLEVVDARQLATTDEVFEAACEHLKRATGDGRITPLMTVMPPWRGAENEIRIWNHQLVRYAAHESADGSILGDPMNLELTRVALALGWRPPASPTRFDLLPLIIQCGESLRIYDLPKQLVREVAIRHPRHEWFGQLGLKWYAVPTISDMIFATGAEVYPCAPFNGWYMGTEIGARDLGDVGRYNQLPVIAEKLGLDTRQTRNLWRDHALVELNEAVLWSFQQEGVRLVDHHQASREFIEFCESEQRAGREEQAEWPWIVPPISGSATPVFHRSYSLQPEFPNYLLQSNPWQTARGRELLQKHRR